MVMVIFSKKTFRFSKLDTVYKRDWKCRHQREHVRHVHPYGNYMRERRELCMPKTEFGAILKQTWTDPTSSFQTSSVTETRRFGG